VIGSPTDLRARTDASRAAGATVGLVPTMGALHEGHASLIEHTRAARDLVVVSIFVNPLQFDDPQDLSRYPEDRERDLERCRDLGVDVVWVPTVEQMYPAGADLASPLPGPVGDSFEGAARPGHFAGVLKAVHRLFDVTGPCGAAFGQKDAQQLFLVRRMVVQEGLPVEILERPTVREPDGLARSSRNALLTPAERDAAGCLFLGLAEAATLARAGEQDAHVLTAAIAREVGATAIARLDYAAVVDDATFLPIDVLEPGTPVRALVAARFPSARLIDNIALPSPAPAAH
jgi:pantoate--beta-alanine ligase